MRQRYEYKFVKLAAPMFLWSAPADGGYERVVEDYAKQGWRLVQILKVPFAVRNTYELILERPIGESTSLAPDDRIEAQGDVR